MPEKKTAGAFSYTDYNVDASASIENDKLSVLRNIAEHGSRGKELAAAQKRAAEATRSGAIQAAADASLAVGGVDPLNAEIERRRAALNAGLDQSLEATAAQASTDFARLSAAEGRYLDDAGQAAALNSQLFDTQMSRAAADEAERAASYLSSSAGGGGGGGDDFTYTGADWTPADAAATTSGPQETEPQDTGGWKYSGFPAGADDPSRFTIQLRSGLDDIMSRGGDQEALGNFMVDYLDSTPLPEAQKAKIMSTMDNFYGISPEGEAGRATAGLYFDPTPQVATQEQVNEVWRQGAAAPSPAKKREQKIKLDKSTYKKMAEAGFMKFNPGLKDSIEISFDGWTKVLSARQQHQRIRQYESWVEEQTARKTQRGGRKIY